MKTRIGTAAAAACAALACATPGAQAITNGMPDDGRHPHVGALVSYDPETGDKYVICSGTLVAPALFLSAAHCLEDEPADLYVSFDQFVGAPDVGPEVSLHHGRAVADPSYAGDTTGPHDTHDLAVVVLDAPVQDVKPARVAPVGTLKALRKGARKLRWKVAGYGREGYDAAGDAFYGGGSRRWGYGGWLGLEDGVFMLSQDGDGEAGTCNGDSGGPIFLGATRTVVGVSTDGDAHCQELGINARLDTRAAHAFLDPYLDAARK